MHSVRQAHHHYVEILKHNTASRLPQVRIILDIDVDNNYTRRACAPACDTFACKLFEESRRNSRRVLSADWRSLPGVHAFASASPDLYIKRRHRWRSASARTPHPAILLLPIPMRSGCVASACLSMCILCQYVICLHNNGMLRSNVSRRVMERAVAGHNEDTTRTIGNGVEMGVDDISG